MIKLIPFCFLFLFQSALFAQACNETFKLIPSNANQSDFFGVEVSIDQDRIIVGALKGNNDTGAVYVYDWDGANWNETIITASNGNSNDNYSISIDLEGDRFVVGAQDHGPGNVYVYDWNGSTWDETILVASDGVSGDKFGSAVALSGNRIVVGAVYDQDNGQYSGSAYIFDYDGTNWIETDKLIASDGSNNHFYGWRAEIDGDRVAITGNNKVYVYELNGSNWNETILNASGGSMGSDLDLVGDTLVVGAPYDDENGTDFGAVYLFGYDGSNWNESKIFSSDAASLDLFGYSVAYDGTKIIAGAIYDDDNGSNSGSAYLFEWDGAVWQEEKIVGSDSQPVDVFGEDVGVSGDRVVIGAERDDEAFTDQGSAYINECCANSTFYADSDGDEFGDANVSIQACVQPSGYTLDNTDCDDNDPNNFPGNIEVCDGFDNNCDGNIDEALGMAYYLDNDGDGFGDMNFAIFTCMPPNNYVTNDLDCDDSDPNNFPGNTEVCDGLDNNCDGIVDEGLLQTYYADTDMDNFGDPNVSIMACSQPGGYVTDNTDCDDSDGNNFPGNVEFCDGLDNNCDGVVDEGCGPPPPCDGDYLEIPDITQDTSRAEVNIESDALVNNGNYILFTAGTDIDLLDGFEVVLGTTFHAKIQPCDNNN